MPSALSRRRLLKLSAGGLAGASALAASACGAEQEEPSAERDVELLSQALEAEVAVLAAYGGGEGAAAQESEVVGTFAEQIQAHIDELEAAIEDAGGETNSASSGGGSAGAGLDPAAGSLMAAIAVHDSVVSELSPELRATLIGVMANDAQQLAVLNGLLDTDEVPFAFVTGSSDPPPFEDADGDSELDSASEEASGG